MLRRDEPQKIRHTNPIIVHNGFLLRKKFSPSKTPSFFFIEFNKVFNFFKMKFKNYTNHIENVNKRANK